MFIPEIVCFDVETATTDGQASTEYWRDDFRVISSSASWRTKDGSIKSKFLQGEEETAAFLRRMEKHNIPLIAHNIQFDWGVCFRRFPEIKLNWKVCTQRLVQCYDGGGKEFNQDDNDYRLMSIDDMLAQFDEDGEEKEKVVKKNGFGLDPSISRILPAEFHSHKKPAHDWIRENVSKVGNPGKYLNHLPLDILKEYNIGDTENTLRLYEKIVSDFKEEGYNWENDHGLYLSTCFRTIKAKIKGIKVDQVPLSEYVCDIQQEVAEIDEQFNTLLHGDISAIEQERRDKWVGALKTEAGRQKRLSSLTSSPKADELLNKHVRFNIGSNKQLEKLFVHRLGITPVFKTDKGNPSFKASHLHTYGEGGELLSNRKKRILVQKQSQKLLEKAAIDGRWHLDLKLANTRTGRGAGGGNLNVQGLSRGDKRLMSSMVPDKGYLFESTDMSSGEPTIITHFTEDPVYRYFNFDGVGQKPFYKDGVLMIDDMYLGAASVNPMFEELMWEAFHDTWDGMSFAEKWVDDAEYIKSALKKKVRKNSKWITLAFGYGMGPKTLLKKATEAGMQVTYKQCKEAFHSYWELFKFIARYKKRLEWKYNKQGYLYNPFGFRLTPPYTRNIFNAVVQSSVSSIFHYYGQLMDIAAPWSDYITVIHDEEIRQIPIDKQDEYKAAKQQVISHINGELKWSVDMRFGGVVGNNMYEAK